MSDNKRILLAHAREDKPQVRDLYDRLTVCGFDPWLDEVELISDQKNAAKMRTTQGG